MLAILSLRLEFGADADLTAHRDVVHHAAETGALRQTIDLVLVEWALLLKLHFDDLVFKLLLVGVVELCAIIVVILVLDRHALRVTSFNGDLQLLLLAHRAIFFFFSHAVSACKRLFSALLALCKIDPFSDLVDGIIVA